MTTSSSTPRRADYALGLLNELLAQTPVGDKLKPERELAAEFGVSRRVIRDALDQLESQGRIVRTPGRGTVVQDHPSLQGSLRALGGEPAPQLSRSQEDKTLSQIESFTVPDAVILGSSPIDLMNARLVLEPAIAATAAMHASTQDIHSMQDLIERGRQAQTPHEWEHWDSALHQRIGDATHNQLLQYFYRVLSVARSQTEWGRLRQQTLNTKNQQLYSEQHAAILQAIQARAPQEAAECMRTHLHTVKRTLIDGIDL
ncbi:FadR/GntR family transcriptional regulator [Paenalcaligenes hominis]|uniref:FadR/GntR family transcriptional regulator n=1 Tax=Paenalcaligenes hominis TaxID=643674 RepID=UPI003524A37D